MGDELVIEGESSMRDKSYIGTLSWKEPCISTRENWWDIWKGVVSGQFLAALYFRTFSELLQT